MCVVCVVLCGVVWCGVYGVCVCGVVSVVCVVLCGVVWLCGVVCMVCV